MHITLLHQTCKIEYTIPLPNFNHKSKLEKTELIYGVGCSVLNYTNYAGASKLIGVNKLSPIDLNTM